MPLETTKCSINIIGIITTVTTTTRIEAWGGLQDMVWGHKGIRNVFPSALFQEPAGKWLSECIYGKKG